MLNDGSDQPDRIAKKNIKPQYHHIFVFENYIGILIEPKILHNNEKVYIQAQLYIFELNL